MKGLPISIPLLAALTFALTFPLVRFGLSWTLFDSVVIALFAAYVPTYFDGSEYEPFNWRDSPAFARLHVWSSIVAYFNGRVVYEATKAEYEAAAGGKQKKQYVLAVHPHGVATLNHGLFMTDACGFLSRGPLSGLAQRRDIAAAVLFRIPLFRDMLLAFGCVDASAPTCHRVLKGGLSLQLYVGGEREQMLAGTETQPIVVARERRGFIKLALQYGLPVIPCYAFNEDRLYYTSTFMLPQRLALVKSARIALPLAYGPYWYCPFIPRNKQILLVVGKPLQLEVAGSADSGSSNISDERVQAALGKYCDELTALFDRHKGEVKGYEKEQLKVF